MKVGLIDVDGHNFPNIPLMKLSAYHKKCGDSVEWYQPLFSGHLDRVYMSKVFSFTPDYEYYVDADEIIKGGSGYAITLIDGKEVYKKSSDHELPHEVEHIYPDYSIYGITDTAYGFLTRGCPRGCDFCHVKTKEGRQSYKVADLCEFWDGQKNIVLCDPNILACADYKDLFRQLIDSRAVVDFNQGLDIRLMTEEKAELINSVKTRNLHFAWDRYEEKDLILPRFKQFRSISTKGNSHLVVYVLCNFDTTLAQDLERIYTLRDIGYLPYVMLYDKENIPKGSELRALQRWVNNRVIFASCKDFNDYER